MWTGGSYEYDDVVTPRLRLDRLEIQPGTTLHKATPVYDTKSKSGCTPWSKFVGEQHWRGALLRLKERSGQSNPRRKRMLRGRRVNDREARDGAENLEFSIRTLNQSERKMKFLEILCCKPARRIDSRITFIGKEVNASQNARGFFPRYKGREHGKENTNVWQRPRMRHS